RLCREIAQRCADGRSVKRARSPVSGRRPGGQCKRAGALPYLHTVMKEQPLPMFPVEHFPLKKSQKPPKNPNKTHPYPAILFLLAGFCGIIEADRPFSGLPIQKKGDVPWRKWWRSQTKKAVSAKPPPV